MHYRKRSYQRGVIKRNHQKQLNDLFGNKSEVELKDVYDLFLNYDEIQQERIDRFEECVKNKFSDEFFFSVGEFHLKRLIETSEGELLILKKKKEKLEHDFFEKSFFERMFSSDFQPKELAKEQYENKMSFIKSARKSLMKNREALSWSRFTGVDEYFLRKFSQELEQEYEGLSAIGISIKNFPKELNLHFSQQEVTDVIKGKLLSENLGINIKYNHKYHVFKHDRITVKEYFEDRFRKIKKRKEERNLRALAAEKTDKQRSLASSNRTKKEYENQISIVSCCPYCGGNLGTYSGLNAAHFEHIHPVSKGGLSTIENTVFICADCNAKKSNMTLNAFISKFTFGRDAVFERLSLLGKDF